MPPAQALIGLGDPSKPGSTQQIGRPRHEALRETAFKERCKFHDLVMEGIGLALRKRGYPAVDDLKAGKKR